MRSPRFVTGTLVALLAATPAWAVPTVDGVRDVEYGVAKAVQTVQTGFGDNDNELDAAYASCTAGRLYLMVTGNLEANFNKLEIFIDSNAFNPRDLKSSRRMGASTMLLQIESPRPIPFDLVE